MLTRSQTTKSTSVKENTPCSNYCITTRASARLAELEPTVSELKNQVRRSERISTLLEPVYSVDIDFEEDNQVRRSERISTVPKPVYSVDIDFEEASQAWMANKRKMGNGMYMYKRNAFQNKV